MTLPYNSAVANQLGDQGKLVMVRESAEWRYADRVWAKQSNSWREIERVYVKDGGTWREVGKYDIYRFRFDLNANNAGSGAAYNYRMLNPSVNSSNDDLYTGSANTSTYWSLSTALTTVSPWSGSDPVIGVVYVNSKQRNLRIDTLPSGSRVVLHIYGNRRIMGRGGNGGNGSQSHSAGGNGANGQTALYARGSGAGQVLLVNYGQIAGGGGGGGGGRGGQCVYNQNTQKSCMKGSQCPVTYQNFSQTQGGGGGGGAGYPGGQRGTGQPNGQNGSQSTGGSGGFTNSCGAQRGRRGGNFGQNGQTLSGTAGSSGNGGNAIDGISYITKITSGTINGGEVN